MRELYDEFNRRGENIPLWHAPVIGVPIAAISVAYFKSTDTSALLVFGFGFAAALLIATANIWLNGRTDERER